MWLPRERAVRGDILMPGCTPFVLMGSIEGSLRTLDRLRDLAPRTVVGGHGPVAGPEVIEETAAYLRWVREAAARGRRPG
ncbi:hypothetical protein ACFQV4_19470 [Streptomyces thermocarboxydus]